MTLSLESPSSELSASARKFDLFLSAFRRLPRSKCVLLRNASQKSDAGLDSPPYAALIFGPILFHV
jgi:hypothetical protein